MFKYLLLFCLACVSLCDELKQPDFAVILPGNQDVWDGMFVTPPLCCPSRENVLTGDATNKNLNGDYYGSKWMHNENSTFASLLTKAGYILNSGKYQMRDCYPKFDSAAMMKNQHILVPSPHY